MKKIWERNSKALILPIAALILDLLIEAGNAVGISISADMSVEELIAAAVGGVVVWLVPMKEYNK